MDIYHIILTEVQQIVAEHTPFAIAVDEMTLLDELHLESVAFTTLIVRLEEKLGFIPSPILQGIEFPETIGDFIKFYKKEAILT